MCESNGVVPTPQLADLQPAEIIFGDNPSWGAGSARAPVTPRLLYQQAYSLRSANTYSVAAPGGTAGGEQQGCEQGPTWV